MQVTLISLGSIKEEHLKGALAEYEKRLSAYCRYSEINLREERITNEDDPASIKAALEAEGKAILTHIPKGSVTVALCVEGKELSSPAFAELVGNAKNTAGKLCFLIGSSHGLAESVKRAADHRISFSRMTFPHQLMRVIFLEQLYRAETILAGKKYHK